MADEGRCAMTDSLFETPLPDPDQERQGCDRCPAAVVASVDGLRVRGWIAFDGVSLTGKPLKVRICPACSRITGGDDHDRTDRLGPVPEMLPGMRG